MGSNRNKGGSVFSLFLPLVLGYFFYLFFFEVHRKLQESSVFNSFCNIGGEAAERADQFLCTPSDKNELKKMKISNLR